MPLVPLDQYLREQQKKQGTEFLSQMQAVGVDLEQYRTAEGNFRIPIAKFSKAPVVPGTGPEGPGLVSGAFQRGLATVGQDLASTGALLAQGGGSAWAQDFFQKKSDYYATRANAIPAQVPDMESIKDIGDLGTYIAERTIEQIPLLGSLLFSGGVVGSIAKLAGAGARGARAAGWTGAYLADVGLQTGESAEIARQAGESPVDLRVIGAGLGKAFLDFLPFMAVAKATGIMPIVEKSIIAQLAQKGYLKRVVGNALLLEATEVPTEIAQEVWNIGLDRALREKGGDLTEEEWSRLKNAAAAAAAVGIGLAPAVAIGRPRTATPEEVEPPEIPTFEFGGFLPGRTEPPPPPTGPPPTADFYVTPEGVVRRQLDPLVRTEASILDAASVYNDKGEPQTLGEEYRRVLADANKQLAFDPASDQIIGKDYARTWRKINPSWTKTSETTFQLGEEVQISQSPQGFEVWSAAGVGLGTFPDIQSAMRRGEEYSWKRTPAVAVDTEGALRVIQPVSGERVAADIARANPEPTQTEQKVVLIEEARTQADQRPDEFTPLLQDREEILLAQLDPGMQRLLELRADTLADADLQRKDNGDLTVRGQKLLGNLNARIGTLATRLGIPNPVDATEVSVGEGGGVESRLSTIAQAAEKARAEPTHPNLSLAESRLLDKLEEKEVIEGLTDTEYQRLEILSTKVREGSDRPFFRKLTKGDIQELETELNRIDRMEQGYAKVVTEEERRAAKETRGVQARVSEVGDYLFQRVDRPVVKFPEFHIEPVGETDFWVYSERGIVGTIFGTPGGFEAWAPGERVLNPALGIQHEPGRNLGTFTTIREALHAVRRDAIQNQQVLQQRSRGAQARAEFKSLTKDQVLTAIAPIMRALLIRPQVRILNLAEVSEHERDLAEDSTAYFTLKRAGEVTIIADNVFSIPEAQSAFVHEVIAHFGLRAFFGPEELTTILREVATYRAEEVAAEVLRRSLGPITENKTPQITLRDAEEFIARKMEEAWIRWKQKEPDWMRDREYEAPGERTFVGKIIAMIQRWLRAIGIRIGKDRWTDSQIASMLKDVALFLSGKITGRNPGGMSSHFRTEPMKRAVGRANLADAIPNMDSFGQVWGAKFATLFLTPIQMAEKYNLPGVADYLEAVQKWWARKRDLTVDAVNVALDWQKIPKREASKLAQGIFEVNLRSDEKGRRLTDQEVADVFREFGVGPTAAALYTRIDESFRKMLEQLQYGLELNALREHTRDKTQAQALHKLWREGKHSEFFSESKKILGNLEVGGRLTQIETEMNELRNRNYFPHMRFGKYGLYVRAKEDLDFRGKEYKGPREGKDGQVVYFETFENYGPRDSRARELIREFPSSRFSVGYGIVSDQEFTFLGMPPSLYETLLKNLQLKEPQVERLKELYFTRSPGRSFLKHLTKRRGIEGFSQDAMRVYAAYMMNAANHIARVEYHLDMGEQISKVREAGSKMGDVAGVVRDYFGNHFDYIMNPETDWAQLRALGFLWYLGFNVKSALVNLTQVPMVAYPYLASVYGDAKATAELSKAYGTVTRMWRGKSVLNDAAQLDLNRAIREGFINESYATELAALSEVPVLQRMLPMSKQGKLLNDVSYYGAWAFQKAELYNRQVVFLAARELALQRGMKGEDVFLAARKAVQTTMFEYAKWNRPKFMRGRRSVFFLFWNYMQHLSFLSFGGQGRGTAIRVWAMLLLVAGLQGLPFAEDLLDLIDLGSTKAKELLGSKDPKTDLRLEIRELAQTLTDQPDLIMHGLSRHYGLGPLHLLQLLGVPVPGADVSTSIGAGRVVPGVQQASTIDRDPDRRLGQAIMDALGPVAGIGFGLWKTLASQDPDQWKVWERAMPSAMRNASQAVRRWDRGAETFRGGGEVATFDPHDWDHRAELIANSLGFQPTRLTERYELRSVQEELKRYWITRRAMVLENYAYAWLAKDAEAMADARDAIRRFNGEAPGPQLRLTADSIERSVKERMRRSDLRTEGLPAETAFQPLYRNVSRLFPGAASPSDRSSTSP